LIHQGQKHHWRIPILPEDWEASHHTGSNRSFKLTQSWLQECTHEHPSCKSTGSPLPSRVVLITGPQKARIYQSRGEIENYACLSHCWGKIKIIQTTLSTLKGYEEELPWEDLSLTFQEAISVAFRLGYKYIWIDSLCIVQDDKKDWRHEGSRMSQIYAGAHLTIAATASSDGSGGCFRRYKTHSLTQISYPAADGSELKLGIRLGVEDTRWHYSRLPLFGRAWAFQELLLSNRVLHCLEKELLWECRTKTTFQLFTHESSIRRLSHTHSPSSLTEILSKNETEIANRWSSIVRLYSGHQLTNEEDIFPALQGISKHMSEHINSPYIAGLWEINIIQGLLWYAQSPVRPQKWRAPSWSWASMACAVTWDRTAWSPRGFTPFASHVTSQIKPVDLDEFGQLESGMITLRGRCFRNREEGVFCTDGVRRTGNIAYNKRPSWMNHIYDYFQDCNRFDGIRPHSEPLIPGQRAKTVLMGTCRSTYHFLILRPVPMLYGTYERFAYMKLRRDPNFPGNLPGVFYFVGREEIIHII